MIPKEKAKELFDKMYQHQEGYQSDPDENAKECALIAVNEILKTNPMIEWGLTDSGTEYRDNYEYWWQVKEEIEKL